MLLNHNWLIKVTIESHLKRILPQYAKGNTLDVGCGEVPYKDWDLPLVTSYVGLDHPTTKHDKSYISVWGEALKLPFRNASFDTVISLAVLEHLEDPKIAIREIARVLRQGGCCILTTVLFWHIHEGPRDFFRFTHFGLQYLFEENGLEVIRIMPTSGFWVTFCQLFAYYLRTINFKRLKRKRLYWFVISSFIFFAQCTGWFLNKFDRSHKFFGNHYIAMASKS